MLACAFQTSLLVECDRGARNLQNKSAFFEVVSALCTQLADPMIVPSGASVASSSDTPASAGSSATR